jgi:hypothetical protein
MEAVSVNEIVLPLLPMNQNVISETKIDLIFYLNEDQQN